MWTLLPHAHLIPTPAQLEEYAELVPVVDDPAFGPWMQNYLSRTKDLRSQMQIFCASLADIDTQPGRLLDELDRLSLAENTIVFFSSDKGPEDYRIRNAAGLRDISGIRLARCSPLPVRCPAEAENQFAESSAFSNGCPAVRLPKAALSCAAGFGNTEAQRALRDAPSTSKAIAGAIAQLLREPV